MRKIWLVVANSSKALIFKYHGPKKNLELVKKFEHPDSRAHAGELDSGEQGQEASHLHAGERVLSKRKRPHGVEMERFSRELSHYLDKELEERSFEGIVLAAGPKFLGPFMQSLNHGHLGQTVYEKVHKDLTALESNEVKMSLLPAIQRLEYSLELHKVS